MTKQRRCLPNFDARSVVLFAACAVGVTLGAHGQTQAQPTDSPTRGLNPQVAQAVMGPSSAKPAEGAATQSAPAAAPAPVPTQAPVAQGAGGTGGAEAAAFARADKDRDGRLSRAEAEQLPMVHQRFDQLDANKDNFLSRDEFDKGMRS